VLSFILLSRSIQASALRFILWLSLKALQGTYYHWDTISGPDIKGNILGVDIELTPSVNFEFGQENNNTINALLGRCHLYQIRSNLHKQHCH
jgi:hypothetical protein